MPAKKSKPDLEAITTRARALCERDARRDQVYGELDDLYFMETPTATDNPAVERIHMPYPTAVIDLITDLAALMEVHVQIPANDESASAQRAADNLEKWLLAWLSLNQRTQQTNVISDAAWYAAQRACVVIRTLYVGDAPSSKTPVVLQVRDPLYVHFEHGALGLRYVVEEYPRLAGEVRELYPNAVSDRIPDYAEVKWREYWDDKYRVYFVNGEPIEVEGQVIHEHGYGCIPYAIGHGRIAPTRNPGRRYRPILAGVKDLSHSIDVAFSIMATASLSGAVSAWAVFADAERELDVSPGAVNQFRRDERLEPIQRATLPADFFQFLTMLLQAWQASTLPFNMYGQSPGNLAGYTISLLSQAGRRVIFPVWRAIQEAIAGAMRNTVTILRNKEPDRKITLVTHVPGENRVIKRKVTLDTSTVGDDFDLVVYLDDPMPSDDAANLRMALESTAQGLLSRQTALTKFKIVPDALSEMDRVAAEAVMKMLMPYEGLKLALERGYIPKEWAPPPGWEIGPDGTIRPTGLAPQQPQRAAPAEPGSTVTETSGLNPATLQAMAAMTPPQSLNEIAGAPPPAPQPESVRQPETPPVVPGIQEG